MTDFLILYPYLRAQKIPCFSFIHADYMAKSKRFFTIKVSTYKIFTLYFILRQARKADKTSGKVLDFLYKEVQLLQKKIKNISMFSLSFQQKEKHFPQ